MSMARATTILRLAPLRSIATRSRVHQPAYIRAISTTAVQKQEQPERTGFIETLLHGSGENAALDAESSTANSAVWDIHRVHVKPEKMAEYRALTSKYHPKLSEEYKDVMTWAGSWEVVIGDIGHFCKYGLFLIKITFGGTRTTLAWTNLNKRPQRVLEFREQVLGLTYGRQNWLTQAFSFWKPSLPPKNHDTIYELRTYNLRPGNLFEWERDWRQGLEARRPYQEPVGAWFSHMGGLHTVFHIWEYPSLEEREKIRAAAWQVEAWSNTVSKTVPMIDSMHSQIMRPIAFRI